LVVEDDPDLRFGIVRSLRVQGFRVIEASTCRDALVAFGGAAVDAVLTDMRLPDGDALELLPALRALDPSVTVYIVTGYGTIDLAVRAVKEGSEDFLTKPLDTGRLGELLQIAVERRHARRSVQRKKVTGSELVARSAAMRSLEEQVERLRDADCSVLLLGETGTGKSMLARRIHQLGARAAGPFVDVNCGGLSREFVESELFGHERGAFTGAHNQKQGLLDAANGGTLFLDEIGDIAGTVQPKVLKVLEEKRFRRLGEVRERSVDVRLVAATHHDLLQAVDEKRFRADLYYRISTVTLTVPSLRDRREDILPLAYEMLAAVSRDVLLSPDAEDKIVSHAWPGNIRELKNVIERAVLLRQSGAIHADDVRFDGGTPPSARWLAAVPSAPPSSLGDLGHASGHASGQPSSPALSGPVSSGVDRPSPSSPPASFGQHHSPSVVGAGSTPTTLQEIEREHIRLALAAENGRVEAAARRLGIPRSTLYQKLKIYGIATSRPRMASSASRIGNSSSEDE